ncbi:ubiquitin-associated protein 2-like [Watersipora subatra]|uniref:ubiquitin-associated protein 2-like n=1 Tax=Watersipora subatra TaxID=2589382 RepID=UPI00355BBF72
MRSNTASTGRLDKNTKMKKADSTAVTTQTNHTQHINDQISDPGLKEKVMQLIEIANCTEDNAILALHDTDNDLNRAAELLLEKNNDMQDGWKEKKAKSKKKQQPQTAAVSEESTETETKESNNRDKSYPRNAPPRLQRGRGSRQDGRQGNFTERRFAGGDRGRPRGTGAHRGGGSSRGRDGFGRSRGTDKQNSEQSDLGNTQIGTWTSEADANPKTDSWGEVWNEEDNQWQGDLKGTHVFESTAKTDAFPTPTEFDPSSVAAMTTTATSQSSSINGSNQLSIDAMFPKETVETMSRPAVSMYDSQRASDSIKSAIGMPTQQQLSDEASKNAALSSGQQSYSGQSSLPPASQSNLVQPLMPSSQPQRQSKQQRSKVPPPSTKIPTAPVEMPHSQTGSIISLGVQFGAMDFNSDASSLAIDSSFKPTAAVSTATLPQHVGQHSLPGSLYTSGSSSMNTHQSGQSPEPIPYPSQSNQSLSSQDSRSSSLYPRSTGLKETQGSHSSYTGTGNVPSQYKSSQSTQPVSSAQPVLPIPPADSHASSQSFQSSQTSSSGSYYQNLTEKRGGYQPSTQSSGGLAASGVNSNQYSGSLYSSSGEQLNVTSSYSHYNNGAALSTPSTASSSASATPIVSTHSQPLTTSSNRLSSAKQPPNLPPPGVAQVTAATPMLPVAPSYIVGNTMPYFNQQTYYPGPAGMEDMQKYQHPMASTQFYEMPNQLLPSSSSFPGTATGGAGESKMTRVDAQSPTAQGSQSAGNQMQQSAPTNTQSLQQFVSLPPGYHASYTYYPAGVPPYTTGVFQGMGLTGSNAAVYSNQQKGSTPNYYPASSTYDDSIQSAHPSHPSEYKNSYGSSKPPTNNMTGGSGSNTDVSSMYKNVNNSQTAAVAANIYGSQATGPYLPTHPQNHVLANQHLMQSQLASVAQEGNISGRGTQGGSIPKGHTKYYQSTGTWPS